MLGWNRGWGRAALLAAALALPAAAQAQPADILQKLSADLAAGPCEPLATLAIHLRCAWQGSVIVETAGDGYRATLPEVTASLAGGRRIALGTVVLQLRPASGGAWVFSLALPTAVRIGDSEGRPEMDVTATAVTADGVWQPALQTVTTLHLTARDLRLAGPGEPQGTHIGAVALEETLTADDQGHWGGPVALRLEGVRVPDGGGGEVFRLGSAGLEGEVAGLDLTLAARRHLESLAIPAAPPPAAGPHARERLRASVLHYLARAHDLFDSASLRLHLSDLFVRLPVVETGVTLGGFDYRTGLAGLERGRSTLSVSYEHGPLAVDPPPPLAEFLPKTAKIALTARGLPNDALWKALEKALTVEDKGGDKMVKSFLGDAGDALTQAGARITVDSFGIDTPATTVALAGEADYAATAAMGMVAHGDLTIRGFDVAMKAIQSAPGMSPPGEEVKNLLSMLTMLQVMGAPGKDEAGRDARVYKLQLAESGAIELNGADITLLVQNLRDRLARPKPAAGAAP